MVELSDEDHRLVRVTVSAYWRRNRSNYMRLGFEYEDLIQIGYVALLKAVEMHDPEKSPLHYFKRIYIRGYVLNALNVRKSVLSIPVKEWRHDPAEDSIIDPEELEHAQLTSEVISVVNKHDSDVDIQALKMLYLDGLTYKEYMSEMGVSLKTVNSRRRHGIRKVRELLDGKDPFLRPCDICGVDISHRHLNSVYCEPCSHERKLERQREAWRNVANKQ